MRCSVIVLSLVLLFAALAGCKRIDDEVIPGLTWTMSDYNPVLEPNSEPSTALCGWYNGNVSFPWVVKEGADFKMWFTGTNTEGEDRIGYASNWDGQDWNYVYENAVFEASPAPGSWDSGGVWNHCVIKDGSEYKMFYSGYESATGSGDKIGLARSSDGLVWTREPSNPVINTKPGTQYEKAVYSGTVLTSGTTYKMWFSGVAANDVVRTFYTTSTDCVTWDTPTVVLDVGPDTYDAFVAFLPSVLFDSEKYHMWYMGYGPNGYAFCYATSINGTNWAKHGVARRTGTTQSWEAHSFVSACVLLDAQTFRMWYAATSSVDGKTRIGYGTSPAPPAP